MAGENLGAGGDQLVQDMVNLFQVISHNHAFHEKIINVDQILSYSGIWACFVEEDIKIGG